MIPCVFCTDWLVHLKPCTLWNRGKTILGLSNAQWSTGGIFSPPRDCQRSQELLCFGRTLLWPTASLSQWYYFSQRPLFGSQKRKMIQMAQDLPRGIVVSWSKQWVGTGVWHSCVISPLQCPPWSLDIGGGGGQDPCSHKQGLFWFYQHVNTMREKRQQPCENKVTACFDHLSSLSKEGPCWYLQMHRLTTHAVIETVQGLGAKHAVSSKTSVGQTWTESNSWTLRSTASIFAS